MRRSYWYQRNWQWEQPQHCDEDPAEEGDEAAETQAPGAVCRPGRHQDAPMDPLHLLPPAPLHPTHPYHPRQEDPERAASPSSLR